METAVAADGRDDRDTLEEAIERAYSSFRFTDIDDSVTQEQMRFLEYLATFTARRTWQPKKGGELWIELVRRGYRGGAQAEPEKVPVPVWNPIGFEAFARQVREEQVAAGALAGAEPVESTVSAPEQAGAARGSEANATSKFLEWIASAAAAAEAGDLEGAEDAYAAALRAGEQTSSAGDASLFAAQLEMAKVQLALGKLAEARAILERLLSSLAARTGISLGFEMDALALLSATYKLGDDFERALDLDTRRVEYGREHLSGDDPALAAAENDRNGMLVATGRSNPGGGTGAGGRGGRAPAGGSSVPQDPNLDGDDSLGDLGEFSDGTSGAPPRRKSRTPQNQTSGPGEPVFEDELAGLSEFGAEDRDARVGVRERWAQDKEHRGDLEGAERLRESNLQDCLGSLSEHDPRVQSARTALARTRSERGDPRGALGLQEAACAVYATTLPADHPALLDARLFLSDLLAQVDETEASLLALEQVLSAEVAEAVAREQLERLLRRAAELRKTCQFEEAVALQREILAAEERVLPADSSVRLESARELAALLRVSGRREEARTIERALSARADPHGGSLGLRARSVEASSLEREALAHAPAIAMALSETESPDALLLTAAVRDAIGIASLDVVLDGVTHEVVLAGDVWTEDPDGQGGRLELRLSSLAPRPVHAISLIAKNTRSVSSVATRSVRGDYGFGRSTGVR